MATAKRKRARSVSAIARNPKPRSVSAIARNPKRWAQPQQRGTKKHKNRN